MKLSAIAILLVVLAAASTPAGVDSPRAGRFFFSGDGHISLISQKNNHSFSGRYRTAPATYDATALQAICRVFDAPYGDKGAGMSLRLIEFIDYLQDQLGPGSRITITSGYRDPQYNTSLRNRGRLAAKASLHQYGMAADLKMEGVPARRIWKYVKELNFGGAGYYHGQTVHVDVGPARSWDETTSGVGTGISDDNKLIGLVTDFDRYLPTEILKLRFIRMTAFPVGVSAEFALYSQGEKGAPKRVAIIKPTFSLPVAAECPQFENIDQMADIEWPVSRNLAPGRYRIHAFFCKNPWKGMPTEIQTPAFRIDSP